MTTAEYIININQRYTQGNATEHTFRGDLQQLIESIVPGVVATNEPKRQACGAPDYILTKKDIPVGFIEAKDVGNTDLEGKKKTGNKEQFDRYKASLSNLMFTDYLDFYLYQDGEFVSKLAIGEIIDGKVVAKPENFAAFENLLKNFCVHIGQNISSSKKLAEMMAGKARLLSDVIERALTSDETHHEDSTLKEQMNAFKDILIHDITPKGFADVYAQTIAYGMFAARLHDPSLETFSRQEAAELIPKSNPFLRKLFGYIAGPDIDDRIKWIVENLAEIFLACNVEEILKNYGKSTKMEDPIIHFYETFLAEYDPSLRKARGVWYTPAPVVNFIVRAVDDILKTEFGLKDGLADSSKTRVKVKVASNDGRHKAGMVAAEKEVHRVQVLDPATGTGTFLAEVIKHVHKKFKGQEGLWSSYVEEHLLPRLNGFELLMASYAMAHLQLDLLLKDTGFKPIKDQRTRVYLTNSLEEYHPDTGTLFANWLSSEANEANHIKRDTPVMCIIGNPPYSGVSSNNGKWISDLIEDYKYVDGVHFNERKHWLNDDYVKFLRYGQHFIEKNESGVLAFINPHGFLDNPTFRGMRWNLLKTYDTIYTIDLHGNSKKKETCPDGSPDVNVFDIMQGVSINIFVKTGKKKENELGKVMHYDLYGKRDFKYDFLVSNTLKSIDFKELKPDKPFVLFVDRETLTEKELSNTFPLNNLFNSNVTGTQTGNDKLLMNNSKDNLLKGLYELTTAQIGDDVIKKINYRPFDNGFMYYIKSSSNENTDIPIPKSYRNRYTVMRNMVQENTALIIGRQGQVVGDMPWNLSFISNTIVDLNMFYRGGGMVFPLYLYPEESAQQTFDQSTERKPNLDKKIVNEIASKLGLAFTNEKEDTAGIFAPIDILDYIYAVLHSPSYREKYKEFLKIDFPRVPYPKDAATFWQLVKLGGEIRQIHLLEAAVVEDPISSYPIAGDNIITTKLGQKDWELYDKENQLGRIWINETQYFEKIPLVAWEFYIGGYQPAQKWLKDRKDRKLDFEDIRHYNKIIVALSETARIMGEVDRIEIE